MIVLSFGYQQPVNGDKGSIFYPALAANIAQCNNHTHDGVTTSKLTAQSITGITATILTANWVAAPIGGGLYRQLVTVPANTTYDAYGIIAQIASGGNSGMRVFPSLEKVSSTTFYIYSNDNSADWTLIYLV